MSDGSASPDRMPGDDRSATDPLDEHLQLDWPDRHPQIVEPQPDFGFDADFRDGSHGDLDHAGVGPVGRDTVTPWVEDGVTAEEAAIHVIEPE
jgi:hypothetical protein